MIFTVPGTAKQYRLKPLPALAAILSWCKSFNSADVSSGQLRRECRNQGSYTRNARPGSRCADRRFGAHVVGALARGEIEGRPLYRNACSASQPHVEGRNLAMEVYSRRVASYSGA